MTEQKQPPNFITKKEFYVFSIAIIGLLLLFAYLFVQLRPAKYSRPTKELSKSVGKCTSCHLNETPGIVHQYHESKHAKVGTSCLDCHQVLAGQSEIKHHGFKINTKVSSKNCASCHITQYKQFIQSRHGAPAWSALAGEKDFTAEQIAHIEKYHPGTVKGRKPNKLAAREGEALAKKGCAVCHSIGKPNADNSIGDCTKCHSTHITSLALARSPETCGQCHMGPDHSQIEIYNESKHGALYHAFKEKLNLHADPKKLSTADMSIPTCATCHMSGLEGERFTHDVTERLSYWLFAPISEKRPNYLQGQQAMKEICTKCHSGESIERFYKESEDVVESVNEKINKAKKIIDDLQKNGYLTKEPFDEPIEYLYFDIWHYYGRTAKHGAFMGGADFVQWHGSYEIEHKIIELEEMAHEIKKNKAHAQKSAKKYSSK